MNETILETIKAEVKSHEYSLDDVHIIEISKAIYKQLTEYATEEDLLEIVKHMKDIFIEVVDHLIPLVEEYEGKIEKVLDAKIGSLISK